MIKYTFTETKISSSFFTFILNLDGIVFSAYFWSHIPNIDQRDFYLTEFIQFSILTYP